MTPRQKQQACDWFEHHVAGFYGPLLRFLDSVVDAGFVHPGHRSQFLAAAEPDDLLDEIARWEPTTIAKWLGPEDR